MTNVDIVDEDDKIISQVDGNKIPFIKDKINRSIAIFVFNEKGELLLQKRSKNKWRYPSHWDCSVSGYVDSNEDYDEAVVRELKEELDITKGILDLEFIFKKLVVSDKREFSKLYKLNHLGPFNFNKEEIDHIEFFSIDDIRKMINNKEKFSPYFVSLFRSFFGD